MTITAKSKMNILLVEDDLGIGNWIKKGTIHWIASNRSTGQATVHKQLFY